MNILHRLAVLVLAASASTFTNGLELGEFKGATFNLGGYIKAEVIWGRPDDDSNTEAITARQSRYNFKASKDIAGFEVSAFYEADFWGIGDEDNPRLRHAYISIDKLTVGETWSGQFYATAPYDVRMINFQGPGFGTYAGNGEAIRPELVAHYKTKNVIISASKPTYDDASMPEMVMTYQRRFETGSGFALSVATREAENVVRDDSAFGMALSFQGKLAFAGGAITGGVFTARGQGPNTGMCANGFPVAPDFAPAPDSVKSAGCDFDANGKMVSQFGFNAGITRDLNKKLNATMRYGKVVIDNVQNSSSYMITATLLYSYLSNVEFGLEWRYQDMANHPLRPIGEQVEVMAKYTF